MSSNENSGSQRLFVYCHECNKGVGLATNDEEARSMAESHAHEDVSWSEKEERDLRTGSDRS